MEVVEESGGESGGAFDLDERETRRRRQVVVEEEEKEKTREIAREKARERAQEIAFEEVWLERVQHERRQHGHFHVTEKKEMKEMKENKQTHLYVNHDAAMIIKQRVLNDEIVLDGDARERPVSFLVFCVCVFLFFILFY